MKNLVLVRGLPGSGKSTFVNDVVYRLASEYCGFQQICADDCWEEPYTKETFTSEKHGKAHKTCLMMVDAWMNSGRTPIFVHNTFTTDKEMEPYMDLAKKYGYHVHTLICENRHESESVHEVPEEVIEKMRERFSVHL